MSQNPEMNPSESKPPVRGSGSALLSGLSRQLSGDEKMVRDLEVMEQAKRYFGGLTEQERKLLGIGGEQAEAATAVLDETAKDDEAQSVPGQPRGHVSEWVWAGLSLLAFVGVAYWVSGGR